MRIVSVIVPAVRWDDDLDRLVETVAAQDLPDGFELETIVALADPATAPSVLPTGVQILPNTSGSIPAGLNAAWRGSRGDVIIRADSRTLLPPWHARQVITILADPQIGCVGGAQLVLDRGVFGTAYAVAFNSPLLGPSVYRYGRRSRPVTTAYLGAWRREVLETTGGFDERLLRNQDNELADRIRSRGLVVWYDAELVVGYTANRGLIGAVRHHHAFGRWRSAQKELGQRALEPVQIAALAVGAAAAIGTATSLTSTTGRRLLVLAGGVTYGAAAFGALASAARLRRARPDLAPSPYHPLGVLLAPALALVIDAAWLSGLLEGSRGNQIPSASSTPNVMP
jgi:hypothetical protein